MPLAGSLVTVNLGSSSAKLAVFDDSMRLLDARSVPVQAESEAASSIGVRVAAAVEAMRVALGIERWHVAAHRMVPRGDLGGRVVRVGGDSLARLRAAAVRAPLHAAGALAAIEALAVTAAPPAEQLVVFDSGFFDELPEVARRYALPRQVADDFQLTRGGYHGLAHQAMWRRARLLLGAEGSRRLITLQLGSGASVAAILDGHPLDVTMGYSPLEGLVMGTRCGDIDPGALLTLLGSGRYDLESLTELLYRRSGLLGVSGRSADLRVLLEATDHDSRLAVELYCHRARRHLGGCLALLGGADAVVFGGGVGEHSPVVRARILQGFEFAGLQLDADANAAAVGGDARIGAGVRAASGAVGQVLVVSVDEASEVARAAQAFLAGETRR